MDSNKDEALRCIGIAKEAIASGNKNRAVKFIGIARRLNENLCVDDLLSACENLDSSVPRSSNGENYVGKAKVETVRAKVEECNYTEENVKLIRQIKRSKDYYSILGVEKSCSVDEIRKAYRKLSLKVHPDKNKAPDSEEAFKIVCKAFQCLSNDESRRQYDQVGLVEGFESNLHYNARRRRRRSDMFEERFDPDDIFRSFFGQHDAYHTSNVYRTRRTTPQPRQDQGDTGPNLMILLQLLPFLLIIVLAYLPFSEPNYSLQRSYSHQFSKSTERYGVEYFVNSAEFDDNFPVGSVERANIESNVIKDYKNMLGRYCHIELQRRQWSRNLPTPHCDKLQTFAA